jgi:two-component system, NarL family, sensor kinase
LRAADGRGVSRPARSEGIGKLRAKLSEAEETLRAIRSGEVDAVVVSGKLGDQVFTLEGAEHAYRVLIESMNEGALTLTADRTILYANQRFAEMVKDPLEQVIGSSFLRFLSREDRAAFRPQLKRLRKGGTKIQVQLNAADGSQVPAQVSIRALAKHGSHTAAVGMVITDMTEGRRAEERLRALTHRVVQVQEAERSRVALELHDNITQLLCAVLFHSQALVGLLKGHKGPTRAAASRLRDMLGKTAKEVERISNNLTPHVLNQLGLIGVLGEARTEFAFRTGIAVKLTCVPFAAQLTAETELALYRIVQEALGNVEKHAGATHVRLGLARRGGFIRLAIQDDGVGFDQDRLPSAHREKVGLGLHSMRERATYVGGFLKIRSGPRGGTEIEVLVPVPLNQGEGAPAPAVIPFD